MRHFVYVAQCGDFTKIGISQTPVARLGLMRFKPARLCYVLKVQNARAIEQLALLYVAESAIGGEYLDCNPRLAIAAVKLAAMETEGRYIEIVDAEKDRWSDPVHNSAIVQPAPAPVP